MQNDQRSLTTIEDTDQFGFMQLADTAVLARIARGEVDLDTLARRELANRGCDDTGRWVGFAAAQTWLELTRMMSGSRSPESRCPHATTFHCTVCEEDTPISEAVRIPRDPTSERHIDVCRACHADGIADGILDPETGDFAAF